MDMDERGGSVRKTYRYRLKPAPKQAGVSERVLWHCRTLDFAAVAECKTARERCHVSVSYDSQKSALPDLTAEYPDYSEARFQVLPHVLLRHDRAFQAFFRRLKAGKRPGYSRFQGHIPLTPSAFLGMEMGWCWMGMRSACPRLAVFLSNCSDRC